MSTVGHTPLRVLTYLAPSIPRELFCELTAYLGAATGIGARLQCDESRSGPRYDEPEPFSSGDADVAFLCSTSYIWLSDRRPPPIGLLGAAAVPADPRAGDRPVYFADVVAPADSGIGAFVEACSVACNDLSSLSGYYSVLFRLREVRERAESWPDIRVSGSHLSSLALVLSGEVDVAAIDSTVLRRGQRDLDATRRLRVLESWGPYPVQPVAVRADLDPDIRATLLDALLRAHHSPRVSRVLARAGLHRFAAVDDEHYEPVRNALTR